MKMFFNSLDADLIKGKHLFLDNDFLSLIAKHEDLFEEFANFTVDSYLIIDPLTEIEFRRDVFIPEQSKIKESFLSKEIFLPIANHQEIFLKLQENVLVLSKIYSHQNQNRNNSLVDLFLAARLMYHSTPALLITGNKKDFPDCVFNTVAVINTEQVGDGNMRAYSIVEFDRGKFDNCYASLQRLEAKQIKI